MRIFFLFILISLSFSAFSQSDVLVTLKGDTLTGKAFIATNKGNAIQVITIKKGKEKRKFKAYEVKWLLKEEETYHPIKVLNKYQLGILVKEGYLSIYKIMNTEANSSASFSTLVLIKKDGASLIVPNLGFKKHVEKFLNDCDVIVRGFSNSAYKKSNLEKIVDDYNGCIAANTTQQNSETFKVEHNLEKVALVTTLIKSIKDDGRLEDTETVVEMLNDLKSKIKEDSKIPSYLENALKVSLKDNTAFIKQLNQILE